MSMNNQGEAREKACPKRKDNRIDRGVSILELSRVFGECNKSRKQTQRQAEEEQIDKKGEREREGVTVLNADNTCFC